MKLIVKERCNNGNSWLDSVKGLVKWLLVVGDEYRDEYFEEII